MNQKKLDRINELTRLSRQRELTEDEKKEREELRMEYRRSFLQSLSGQLDNITLVDPDGTKTDLKDIKKS